MEENNKHEKHEQLKSLWFSETAKLQEDLLKVEQLEAKITEEYEQLQTQISTMEQDLDQYHDTDKLRQDAEDKKKVSKRLAIKLAVLQIVSVCVTVASLK